MSVYKLPEYKQHPVALALMPGGMDDTEFDAFCADVEERGILFPASLYEGMVLDGWHRYRAAKRTGSELKFIEYKGKDPAGYIASCNVLRRKLSSLQRALVGARLHRDHGITQREACKKLGISNEVITLVLKTLDSKNTKLIKRIEAEADFTRGMLKEELEDAGLLRAKPKTDVDVSTLTNSVFDMGRTGGVARDTDGTEGEDDMDDLLGTSVGKGLKADQRAARKPKETVSQTMQQQYEALMHDEKISFLQMIWPTASKLLSEAGLSPKPALTVVDTPLKALKRSTPRDLKKSKTA